ncbi:L,D-transpeptidase family protein [Myceligenerans pegani]|uniref:Murein L,D-transpeptidase n=1 Tax=Myceligenerans pegani TaxID=2776917 RepID=A0ABR9N584_9MICO|nr:L,D-transpeptidase family protein [Myceligenerans sp. TRM 65318]MBE1878832.1 murein L,D-transpeptidase [Myceligenerans sp. TRM 65318]MBE3021103.1 murein L,D-transpeptidase [Myceligenerans sp. TRM 65318]
MSRTYGGSTARRTGALLTALLLTGSMLAGCSADGNAEAEATSSGSSPAAASPSPSGTSGGPEDASPEPSGEPSGGEESAEPSPEASDEDDDADASPDDGRDDDGEDDGRGQEQDDDDQSGGEDGGDGNGGEDGDGTDESADDGKDGEPELPEYIAFGEHSERVADVQQRLQDLGYYITAVDGAYGGETQQALWALQKAGGLYRDGVVGPQTRQALDNGVVPTPRSSSGKVIEIDIARQLVLAVENGRVVRTINAASGNGERFEAKGRTYTASTPRGDFAVYNEIDGMHSSTLELGDMWRPKYFNGAIALHGSSSVPPFPASHGCVRVSNSAMNWIWDTWGAPRGTRVLVY